MNNISKSLLDKVLAARDFNERLCLVKTSDDHIDASAVTGNEVAAYQLWPALIFNSYKELQHELKETVSNYKRTIGKITVDFTKLCRTNPGKFEASAEYGIAYLLGKSRSSLVFVPKNSHGIVEPDNHDVFDYFRHVDQMEQGTGYCGSEEFQAAYKLVMNRMEQYSGMNDEKGSESADDEKGSESADDEKGSESADGDDDDDDDKKSPTGVISSICRRLFGGGNKVQKEYTNEEKNDTSNVGPPDVHRIVAPPRGATDECVESPPSEEANDTTDLSERVDGSLYAGDESVAVVHPADKDVNIIGGKRKRGRSRHRSRHKSNKSKVKKVVGGCRMIPSSMLSTSLSSNSPIGNEDEARECLLRAILPLLTLSDQEKNRVALSIRKNMPEEGDTSIGTANRGLSKHGLRLESVTEEYDAMKGGIMFNLLQKETCKLVIKIRLSSPRWNDDYAHHFIGFDGGELYDEDVSARLHRIDRVSKKSCHAVFKALFPAEKFSKFEVTNVYELQSVSGEGRS